MIKPEMRTTPCLLDVDASWLTMPVFIGVMVFVAFLAIAITLWNAATQDDNDDPDQ